MLLFVKPLQPLRLSSVQVAHVTMNLVNVNREKTELNEKCVALEQKQVTIRTAQARHRHRHRQARRDHKLCSVPTPYGKSWLPSR
mmetsp:Transcript_26677/g.53566  ORF Transcript_26677/g.53566 Transcript_26677/m.53566 type:complete len:85 (-) Transcript_26677:111-365(-)